MVVSLVISLTARGGANDVLWPEGTRTAASGSRPARAMAVWIAAKLRWLARICQRRVWRNSANSGPGGWRGSRAARMPLAEGARGGHAGRGGVPGCWACWACWRGSGPHGGRPECRDHGRMGDRGGSRGWLRAWSAGVRDQFMIMEHRAGGGQAAW